MPPSLEGTKIKGSILAIQIEELTQLYQENEKELIARAEKEK